MRVSEEEEEEEKKKKEKKQRMGGGTQRNIPLQSFTQTRACRPGEPVSASLARSLEEVTGGFKKGSMAQMGQGDKAENAKQIGRAGRNGRGG